MPTDATFADLIARAEAWLADDPDPATRAELTGVIEAARAGEPGSEAADDLADRFAGMLQFGTAGLRGILGAGPNRMNRAVVIRAAAGLVAYLQAGGRSGTPAPRPAPSVVVGFDARHDSDVFARDTAAVVTAAGGRALLLPRPLPTPLLAFAIRHLGADAGVMVTASHNPARDNGYKVYLGDGSQIVPPADVEIAACIDAVESVASVARADGGWTVLGEEVVDAYLDAVVSVVAPETPRALAVVHTSMHGVGGEIVLRAFERAGFPRPVVVEEQAAPDPDFPTVPFPNPEEPGAIDLALALARRVHPDVVIASDPDADRCAVAVPDPAAATAADPAGWRMLRGDEVGVLAGRARARPRGGPGRGARRPRPLDRLIAPARRHGRGGRRARRRDPHRVQVDRPRAAPPLRLRGGDRVLRRPRERGRQGRDLGGAAHRRHGGQPARPRADAARRSRRPRTCPRRVRDRRTLGPGHGPVAHRGCDGPAARPPGRRDRRRRRSSGSTTWPRAPGPASHRPTACATSSRTTRGSSCAPPARSRSSRSTSRRSSTRTAISPRPAPRRRAGSRARRRGWRS